MTPIPETAALLAQRGPAALHLAGWFATASFLFSLLAMWDERRRAWPGAAPAPGPGPGPEPGSPAHRRCPRKPT